MADQLIVMDELDQIANEVFPGLVVRKDLLRRMRSSFGVPAFVIEFLLGKYCASTDEETINEGLGFVRETLSSKYVKPDEREAVKSAIKQHSTYEVIDKISVELVETHNKYWARLSNLNLDYINIDESEVRNHDRLLMGGIWRFLCATTSRSFSKPRTGPSLSTASDQSSFPTVISSSSSRVENASTAINGWICSCGRWATSRATRTLRLAGNCITCFDSSPSSRRTSIPSN